MAHTMCMAVALMLANALARADQCSSGRECPTDNKAKLVMSLIQTNLHMNELKGSVKDTTGETGSGLGKMVDGGKKTGSQIALDSQDAAGQIKLIVNSDVRYSYALDTLFESMENVGFDRWHDVIVMRGSASDDSDPFTPETKYGERGVTYINLKLSSFDLHGLSGLYHHRHHPRVKADVYFYIHDTVLVSSEFPFIFNSMASTEEFEARHPPFPFKNQCVFGSGVVDAYGTFFDIPKTKENGVFIEKGIAPFRNVVTFAKKQTELEGGQESPERDLWHTGYPWEGTYYPSLGLTKYTPHSIIIPGGAEPA